MTHQINFSVLGKVRFFLGGGEGEKGGWRILVFFSEKVSALPYV